MWPIQNVLRTQLIYNARSHFCRSYENG